MTIAAGDDGIHADTRIAINGGSIQITKSYEGIESANIDVNGGTIKLVFSDDGFNVAGGADSSSVNGRTGQNSFTTLANSFLNINSGSIVINAGGDGLDSNGSMTMSGGTVTVSGPTANNNGAIDYNGTFKLTGGVLVAADSAGMAQAPGTTSTQNTLQIGFTSAQAAGTPVNVIDSTGKTIITVTPAKPFQSIVISSPDLKTGSSYTVTAGGTTVTTMTISSVLTTFGSTSGMGGGMKTRG